MSPAKLLGDPEVTANIYCKSRNLTNTDTQNYSTDLRLLLGHPVYDFASWQYQRETERDKERVKERKREREKRLIAICIKTIYAKEIYFFFNIYIPHTRKIGEREGERYNVRGTLAKK